MITARDVFSDDNLARQAVLLLEKEIFPRLVIHTCRGCGGRVLAGPFTGNKIKKRGGFFCSQKCKSEEKRDAQASHSGGEGVQINNSTRVLRIPETEKLTGLCSMQIWRLERSGHFPKRFKLAPGTGPRGAIGHDLQEVLAWIEERKASRLVEHGA